MKRILIQVPGGKLTRTLPMLLISCIQGSRNFPRRTCYMLLFLPFFNSFLKVLFCHTFVREGIGLPFVPALLKLLYHHCFLFLKSIIELPINRCFQKWQLKDNIEKPILYPFFPCYNILICTFYLLISGSPPLTSEEDPADQNETNRIN